MTPENQKFIEGAEVQKKLREFHQKSLQEIILLQAMIDSVSQEIQEQKILKVGNNEDK